MDLIREDYECDPFYKKAEDYWSEIPATIDGMLGGFAHISQVDIQGSKQFLKQLFQSKKPPGRGYVCDCGAGIGRITRFLLASTFDNVDLVEQNPSFLEQAKDYLGENAARKVRNFYPSGLQNFIPEPNRYDVIWCQWVLSHLTDDDLVTFLRKCSENLRENGVIIIKENVTSTGKIEKDEKDSSMTRPYTKFIEIFKAAEVDCFKKVKQPSFPRELYTVYMFALRKKRVSVEN